MKKYLSHILRFMFAAAGITYIAITLTWSDHLTVPANTAVSANETLEKEMAYPVVEGELIGDGPVTIQIDEANTMVVERSQIGPEATDYRIKPGITTTLGQAKPSYLIFGLLIVGPIFLVQSLRWWLLLRSQDLHVPIFKAFRLTMVGTFFNYCMPGTTGGDVIKAYYAAKNSDRRADSVMTVIFDRIVGLLGLILLGGFAGLFMVVASSAGWVALDEQQLTVLKQVTAFIWLGILGGCVGASIYYSRRLRRLFGINWNRVQKLPGHRLLVKIDDAALAYKSKIKLIAVTVLMSVPVHIALATGTALAGYALGMETPLGLILTIVPVLFLAAAVPLTYQGLGVMEGLAMALILNPTGGATENQIVGMLLLIRAFQIFYGLLGSLFLLKGDIHMHPEQDGTLDETSAGDKEAASPEHETALPASASVSTETHTGEPSQPVPMAS